MSLVPCVLKELLVWKFKRIIFKPHENMRIQYRKVGNGSDIRKINISITPYGLLRLFYEKVPFWTTQTNNKILMTTCLSFTNKYTKARLYGTCFVPSWIKIRYMAITCTDKTTGAKNASCVKAIIKTQRYLNRRPWLAHGRHFYLSFALIKKWVFWSVIMFLRLNYSLF